MRISFFTLPVSTFALTMVGAGLFTLSSPAYAGSSATGPAIVYGSGSYGNYDGHKHKKQKKHHKQKQHQKHKHHKQHKKHKSYYITSVDNDVKKPHHAPAHAPAHAPVPMISHAARAGHASYGRLPACPVGSSRAAGGLCMSTGSRAHTTASHTTGLSHSSRSHYASTRTNIVPFTRTVNNISGYKLSGMGRRAPLAKISCPTSVYTPQGGQVQGCYPVVKPVVPPRPIIHRQAHYQQIQVVRPVIYVRYPVPTPIIIPQIATCAGGLRYSRYGNAWPRAGGGCGGW